MVVHLLENKQLDSEKYVDKCLAEQKKNKSLYPLRPRSIVIYGFGRIGRILTKNSYKRYWCGSKMEA